MQETHAKLLVVLSLQRSSLSVCIWRSASSFTKFDFGTLLRRAPAFLQPSARGIRCGERLFQLQASGKRSRSITFTILKTTNWFACAEAAAAASAASFLSSFLPSFGWRKQTPAYLCEFCNHKTVSARYSKIESTKQASEVFHSSSVTFILRIGTSG